MKQINLWRNGRKRFLINVRLFGRKITLWKSGPLHPKKTNRSAAVTAKVQLARGAIYSREWQKGWQLATGLFHLLVVPLPPRQHRVDVGLVFDGKVKRSVPPEHEAVHLDSLLDKRPVRCQEQQQEKERTKERKTLCQPSNQPIWQKRCHVAKQAIAVPSITQRIWLNML
jgi:hypothetical protein